MELPEVKEHLQIFFDQDVVTIVGSGLSCAEGLPGMGALANELIGNVPKNITADSMNMWKEIEKEIKNGQGLEEILLKNKTNESIEIAIKSVTEEFIRIAEKNVIREVARKEKTLRFSKYIKKLKITTDGVKIITTNYDRLIEIACEAEGILVDNLFTGNYISRVDFKSKNSFLEDIERGKRVRAKFKDRIIVYKPHGCLGWYMRDGEIIYSSFNLGIENLIITPGTNKYRKGYDSPFDIHRESANKIIDMASCFVIIGYGFNDDHLETHLINRIKGNIATLIITRDISDKILDLIKICNMTAVYHYENKYESGTVVNIKGECIYLKDSNIWDLGIFVEEVL